MIVFSVFCVITVECLILVSKRNAFQQINIKNTAQMESNLFLITNADVFTPEAIGKNDVLVAGGKIIAIRPQMASQVPMAKII